VDLDLGELGEREVEGDGGTTETNKLDYPTHDSWRGEGGDERRFDCKRSNVRRESPILHYSPSSLVVSSICSVVDIAFPP